MTCCNDSSKTIQPVYAVDVNNSYHLKQSSGEKWNWSGKSVEEIDPVKSWRLRKQEGDEEGDETCCTWNTQGTKTRMMFL